MDNLPDELVSATDEHAIMLARALSADHLREIADTAGLAPVDAIRMSMRASRESYAFVPNGGGAPVFMMGVEEAGRLTGNALLWMLASDDIRRHAAKTLRLARWGLRRAFIVAGAERLEQYIPEWYATGIRFARRLGFAIDAAPYRGRNGAAILRVVLHRKEYPWAS